MTEPTREPLYATPEPGAIVFIDVPEITTGYTDDEIQVLFTSSAQGFTAAADAQTGAMIAFIPSDDDLERFVLVNYEPISELHITVLFLGKAATIDDQSRADLLDAVADFASRQPAFTADAFAVAAFNPSGENPCLVVQLSGPDLADARESLVITADDADAFDVLPLPEQHEPWIPHMTLAYDDQPLRLVTDDLLTMLPSPVVVSKVRVAFAGEVHDFPLGGEDITASVAFHMPGKHNQATHGRGGASPTELAAGERLNRGKKLDASDPEQAQIIGAIQTWTGGGNAAAVMNHEIEAAVDNPMADTAGAKFTRVVAGAPANAPTLHRGMPGVHPDDVPGTGDVIALGPTSFTTSTKVRDKFSRPASAEYGRATQVHYTVRGGSRAVSVSQHADPKFGDEKEWVGLGRYRVTSSTQRQVTVKAKDGLPKVVTLYEVELTQVDDGIPVTNTKGGKPPTHQEGW